MNQPNGKEAPKFGTVALIGRPNAGKSTLLNRLVEMKISIVSDKPQTTRNAIRGILNHSRGQAVLVDTPGIHKPGYEMNRRMLRMVYAAIHDVDLLVVITDASRSKGAGDQFVLEVVKKASKPALLLLNKVDCMSKHRLLPLIDLYHKEYEFLEIIPISALDGTQVELMVQKLMDHLPEGEPLYPADYVTDRTERFLVGEMIREKILQHTHEELPYTTAVVIERFDESERESHGMVRLAAKVVVEKTSQQGIIIGAGGSMIKAIGIDARRDIEALLGCRLFLELAVRTKEHWRNNPTFLESIEIGPGA
jgi:GTPase